MEWIGVDISSGPGVDFVVETGSRMPFDEGSFDLVVASSVFEHDIQFWNTFLEMSRVVKNSGLILIIAPSQGPFHRFPLDAFRFYPDSGMALEKWAQTCGFPLALIESFTTRPENDFWADYIAIYSGSEQNRNWETIGNLLSGENWIIGNELVASTRQEIPFELRRISELENRISDLIFLVSEVNSELLMLKKSRALRLAKSLRVLTSFFKKIITINW
jgi:SAM-dependent methyltransferase